MPYILSNRSVTDGVSLSVIKSKLVYSSLISVDNKLTLLCLLTQQQLVTVSVHYTQVILLIWRVLHLWGIEDKSLRRFGCMKQSTIKPVALPNVHRFKKKFHQQIGWRICNEVARHNFLTCYTTLSYIINHNIHISGCCQFSDIHITK